MRYNRLRSCIWCFNLKYRNGVIRCLKDTWKRIYYPEKIVWNRIVHTELRKKAIECENFTVEKYEKYRK